MAHEPASVFVKFTETHEKVHHPYGYIQKEAQMFSDLSLLSSRLIIMGIIKNHGDLRFENLTPRGVTLIFSDVNEALMFKLAYVDD